MKISKPCFRNEKASTQRDLDSLPQMGRQNLKSRLPIYRQGSFLASLIFLSLDSPLFISTKCHPPWIFLLGYCITLSSCSPPSLAQWALTWALPSHQFSSLPDCFSLLCSGETHPQTLSIFNRTGRSILLLSFSQMGPDVRLSWHKIGIPWVSAQGPGTWLNWPLWDASGPRDPGGFPNPASPPAFSSAAHLASAL